MKLTYADDIQQWSRIVCRRGKCTFPGCSSKFGLGGHHIIPRGEQEMKLLVENGVCLCTEHHDQVEEMKGREQYDRTMVILIGKGRYSVLKALAAEIEATRTARPEIEMPTSELDF